MPRLLWSYNKQARTITFHVREGFGDGRHENRLTADEERQDAVASFGKALDAILDVRDTADPAADCYMAGDLAP